MAMAFHKETRAPQFGLRLGLRNKNTWVKRSGKDCGFGFWMSYTIICIRIFTLNQLDLNQTWDKPKVNMSLKLI